MAKQQKPNHDSQKSKEGLPQSFKEALARYDDAERAIYKKGLQERKAGAA